MKKIVFMVVLLGMFAWAVYSFSAGGNNASKENQAKQQTDDAAQENQYGLEKGDMAPDFKLKTMDGEEVKLSDYRGKRVLVNFWATWCPPCRAEIPDLEKFHKNTDIVLLGVNLASQERSQTAVSKFIKKYEMTYPVLMDKNGLIAELYNIQPIPTSYLIDTKGRVFNKALGALNYDQMAAEYKNMN